MPAASETAKLQKQMQNCLSCLNVTLKVLLTPDITKNSHGEIKGNVIFIYDSDEREAWKTFTHEIFEYKLKSVTRPYRLLINSLIEAFEKSIYSEKEQFIEFLPKVMEIIKESQPEESRA
jgi:hypothetical protein